VELCVRPPWLIPGFHNFNTTNHAVVQRERWGWWSVFSFQ